MSAECVRCDRPILRAARSKRLPEGWRRHGGRGLCGSCYRKRPRVPGQCNNQGARTGAPDEVAVRRAVGGERLALSAVDRHAAVHACRAAGLSIDETARRLGLSSRRVTRWRSLPLNVKEAA